MEEGGIADQINGRGRGDRQDRWKRDGTNTREMEEEGSTNQIDGGQRGDRPDRWRREGTQTR